MDRPGDNTPTLDTGGFISLLAAREMKTNFENHSADEKRKGHFVGKNKLLEVLNQSNIIGVRVYHGLKPQENDTTKYDQEIMFVGVNTENEDVLDTGKILDFTLPCPKYCPPEGKGL